MTHTNTFTTVNNGMYLVYGSFISNQNTLTTTGAWVDENSDSGRRAVWRLAKSQTQLCGTVYSYAFSHRKLSSYLYTTVAVSTVYALYERGLPLRSLVYSKALPNDNNPQVNAKLLPSVAVSSVARLEFMLFNRQKHPRTLNT